MNPTTTDLAELAALRLSSGIEMQQRWQSHAASGPTLPSTVSSAHNSPEKLAVEPPHVVDFTPMRGNSSTVVTVVLQAIPLQMAKLAFNSLVVDTKQMQSAHGLTTLVAQVPHIHRTSSRGPVVPVSLCLFDDDSVTETWTIAEFTYAPEDAKVDSPSYKRNHSFLRDCHGLMSADTPPAAGYQSFYQQQQREQQQQQQPHQNSQPRLHLQPHSHSQQQLQQQRHERLASSTSPAAGAGYAGVATQQMPQYSHPYDNRFAYRTTSRQSHSNLVAYSHNLGLISPTQPESFSGVFSDDFGRSGEQSLPATTVAYHAQSHALDVGNGAIGRSVVPVSGYHPYNGMSSRTNLDISGSLSDMAQGWTSEEWEHRRRLVQFWREQGENQQIRCTFRPVAPDELFQANNGQIAVSCIYWAERSDCYITSVDCIHLLENLLSLRFSVEEKNRVRRNLEGFRPLTVSKCKTETAGFFKLIMGFPNPKPRNIEKDVKVFPWKTLPYALKKIVTKYTTTHSNSNNSVNINNGSGISNSTDNSNNSNDGNDGTNNNSVPATAAVTGFYQHHQTAYSRSQTSHIEAGSSASRRTRFQASASADLSPENACTLSNADIDNHATNKDENEYHRQMTQQVIANLKTEE